MTADIGLNMPNISAPNFFFNQKKEEEPTVASNNWADGIKLFLSSLTVNRSKLECSFGTSFFPAGANVVKLFTPVSYDLS